jgi:hypothetical protein
MASALVALANATAVFNVATVGTTVDPVTGNVLPVTETIEVSLYLRQGSLSPNDLPGVDVDADAFEGYAISPQALDARVRRGVRGTLTWAGDAVQPCEVAELRDPFGTSGLLGSTLQQVLGDRIRVIRYRQR